MYILCKLKAENGYNGSQTLPERLRQGFPCCGNPYPSDNTLPLGGKEQHQDPGPTVIAGYIDCRPKARDRSVDFLFIYPGKKVYMRQDVQDVPDAIDFGYPRRLYAFSRDPDKKYIDLHRPVKVYRPFAGGGNIVRNRFSTICPSMAKKAIVPLPDPGGLYAKHDRLPKSIYPKNQLRTRLYALRSPRIYAPDIWRLYERERQN